MLPPTKACLSETRGDGARGRPRRLLRRPHYYRRMQKNLWAPSSWAIAMGHSWDVVTGNHDSDCLLLLDERERLLDSGELRAFVIAFGSHVRPGVCQPE